METKYYYITIQKDRQKQSHLKTHKNSENSLFWATFCLCLVVILIITAIAVFITKAESAPVETVQAVQAVEMVEVAEPERISLGTYRVTGYVPTSEYCCGKTDGIGANGQAVQTWINCATSDEFEFGTEIIVDGLGTFIVSDRGVSDGTIDIACNTFKECYEITGTYEIFMEVE